MVRTKGATAEQTRQRIISAALELFAERTFAGTAMRDIADALSLTKAAVYYHFDSKDALLEAILRPLAESLDQLVTWTIATRAALEPADAAGDIALKVATVRRLVDIQLANLSVMQTIMFDPSAMRVVLERGTFTGFNVPFDRAFAGSQDEQVLLRHRCAIGAITGGLRLTTKARGSNGPSPAATTSTPITAADRGILVGAALAVLGITESQAAGIAPRPGVGL